MPKTTFLFINKNAKSSSLTHGAAEETTVIQQFVQKGRKRRRKGKIESLFKPVELQPRAQAARLPRTVELHGSKLINIAEANENQDSGEAILFLEESRLAVAKRPADPAVPPTVSASPDPFQTTPVTIDETVRGLLMYYTTIYHPTLWPNESEALRRGGYVFENAVNHVVYTSLHDSLAMYCLLTASLCRLRHVDHLPFSGRTNENLYMSQALSLMQARINKAAAAKDTNLLYLLTSVIFLAAAEAYRDGFRASRVHLEAAMGILKYANTDVKQVADPNLQGQFFMSDLFLGCVNLEPCLFPSSDYDPGPSALLKLQPAELLPVPFELEHTAESLLSNSSLSPEVKILSSQIRDTYILKRCLNTILMSPKRALQTTHWITKRNMAIRNRLLSVFTQSSNPVASASILRGSNTTHEERNQLVERVVRAALIMYTLLSMNITGRVKTVKVMARHLQALFAPLLADTTSSETQASKIAIADDHGLLLWIVVIGYSCAQDNSDTEQWFAQQYQALSLSAGCAELDRLQSMQSTFFYHAQIQRPRLQKLIDGRTVTQ